MSREIQMKSVVQVISSKISWRCLVCASNSVKCPTISLLSKDFDMKKIYCMYNPFLRQ